MARKLSEMNEVIRKYAEAIDDDTMLIVMGDHGMTDSGDHGGSSDDETEALLFAYSKSKPFVSRLFDNYTDEIQQIDFTSTLATILGVPIPFSNLGSISFQLLPDISYSNIQRRELLAMHLWQNAKQIKNYFNVYSLEDENVFSNDALDDIDAKYDIFEHRVDTIHSDEAFRSLAGEVKNHLTGLLEMCREIWINFNPRLMTQGMVVAFLGIFTAFIITFNIPPQDFHQIFTSKLLIIQACSSVVAGVVGYLLHNTFAWDDGLIAALFMSSVSHAVFFGFVIIQNWTTIVENMSAATNNIINLVPRVTFAFSVVVFFSNSFIVQEQRILCFLLSIQIIYAVYEIRKSTTITEFKGLRKFLRSTFFKIIFVAVICITLLRLSSNYFKCREEQNDCWDYLTNSESGSKDSDRTLNFMPVIMLALLVALVRGFLKANGNLTGFSAHVLLMKFGPTVSVIATCGYLVLSQKQLRRPIVSYVHLDTLAWIVYAIFVLEIIIIGVSPLLVYVLPRNNDKVSVSNHSNMIPELYRHMKSVFNDQGRTRIPIVYGLATVYSSIFIAFGTLLSIVLALLLGVHVSNGFLIILSVASGVLFIFTILRYESATNIKDCLQPNFSLIATWFLLYSYGFYSTSHQPTISQIDWNAAFVGRTANFDHSNVISAILVLLSTFNSNIILLVLYPLLVLSPFMIYSIYPSLSTKTTAQDVKKSKDDVTTEYRKITLNDDSESAEATSVKSVTRGEVSLYENEHLFLGSTFKVGCQFVVMQGTKALASMIACTILCRHLMVWKIFAPRFIYEGISSYVSFVAIIVGFMLLLRVHKSVKSLVTKINKDC
jgi:phosphatidylinositol glycan class O